MQSVHSHRQQTHRLQLVDAVLGGEIGAVEVVDAAFLGVGLEEGLFDDGGNHGRGWAESFVKNRRWSNALAAGWAS